MTDVPPLGIGRTKEFRAKTQEDMGGLLPGDDVESHWPKYRTQAALVKVTHCHPLLHIDVNNKRRAVRKQSKNLRKTKIF